MAKVGHGFLVSIGLAFLNLNQFKAVDRTHDAHTPALLPWALINSIYVNSAFLFNAVRVNTEKLNEVRRIIPNLINFPYYEAICYIGKRKD